VTRKVAANYFTLQEEGTRSMRRDAGQSAQALAAFNPGSADARPGAMGHAQMPPGAGYQQYAGAFSSRQGPPRTVQPAHAAQHQHQVAAGNYNQSRAVYDEHHHDQSNMSNLVSIRDDSTRSQYSLIDPSIESLHQRIAKLENIVRDGKEKTREAELRASAFEEEARNARARIAELEALNRDLELQNRELRRYTTVDPHRPAADTSGAHPASNHPSLPGHNAGYSDRSANSHAAASHAAASHAAASHAAASHAAASHAAASHAAASHAAASHAAASHTGSAQRGPTSAYSAAEQSRPPPAGGGGGAATGWAAAAAAGRVAPGDFGGGGFGGGGGSSSSSGSSYRPQPGAPGQSACAGGHQDTW
jgi:hypothetical protein